MLQSALRRPLLVAGVLLALAAAMLATAVPAQAAAPVVRVTATVLAPLPGDIATEAWAINDRGEIVGRSGESAVKWVEGVPTPLAAPPEADGPFVALGVDEAGTAVGRDGFERFCVWAATGRCDVIDWGWGAYATDVNAHGLVVGGTEDEYAERGWWWDTAGGDTPVLVEPATLDAGADPELSGTRIVAVNDAGEMAGTAWLWIDDDAGPQTAFVLVDGQPQILRGPGGADSAAADLNDAGVVVGTAGDRATLWAGGTATSLGTLGGDASEARAVNAAGQVLGVSETGDGERQAFLWADGVLAALETAEGPVTGEVRDLNDRGQIVGTTYDDDGSPSATLWTVEPASTPASGDEPVDDGPAEPGTGDPGDDDDGDALDGDSAPGGSTSQPRRSPFAGEASTRVAAPSVTAQAVAVSQARFGDGGAEHVVLSRSDVFADSLAGAALLHDGPLLLVASDALPADTAAELQRVLPAGGKVHVLGGDSAVSAVVAEAVADLGYEVVRLAGDTRVETAVAVAREVLRRNPAAVDAVLARADGPAADPSAAWADSITGGGWAAAANTPLLLTPTEALHPAVAAFLADMGPERTVLLGGTAALSPAVEAAVPHPQRIAGLNRADTAARIAQQLWASTAGRYVVINGYAADGWAHGLPAAGISADAGAPLLVVQQDAVPPETQQHVVSACAEDAAELLVVGSEQRVSSGLQVQLGTFCAKHP